MTRFATWWLAAALAGCALDPNDPRALRNVGEDCVSCHREGGKAAQWPYGAGGTVYRAAADSEGPGLEGVRVRITDSGGRRVELRSNRVGNFWTREALVPPLAIELQREGAERSVSVGPGPCASGSCNACHVLPGRGGARGRLYAPR